MERVRVCEARGGQPPLRVHRTSTLRRTTMLALVAGLGLWSAAAAVIGMTPAQGVTHEAMSRETPVHGLSSINGKSSSTDWAGYAVTGSNLKSVSGSWRQPAVTCPVNQVQQAAFWVGIDGYSSNDPTVQQIGTDSDCTRMAGKSTGTPNYYAWYEMYPQNVVYISKMLYPVFPGDVIATHVSRTGSTYTLSVSDPTRRWVFTTVQTATTTPLEFLRGVDRGGTLLGGHAVCDPPTSRLPHDCHVRSDRREHHLRVRPLGTRDHDGHVGWDGEGLPVCALLVRGHVHGRLEAQLIEHRRLRPGAFAQSAP